MSELDSLLDMTLDDLNDLPSFKPFPPGAHKLLATLETEKISVKMKKSCVELSFVYVEPVEFVNPEDQAAFDAGTGVKAGDTSSTLFMLDNEFGQGNFKKCAAPLGAALNTGNLREIIEQTTDMEVIAVTSIQVDKRDKEKVYLNVKEMGVV